MSRYDPFSWTGLVDAPALVRGASTGFTVLVIGGLTAPLGARLMPVTGAVWLPLVAVVAFAVAGAKIGTAPRPPLHGAIAALAAYLLVLPLVFLGGGAYGSQLAVTAAAALLIGAIAGAIRARMAARTPSP